MGLVVDASVALKWVLDEPDSHLAITMAQTESNLLIPDFWLEEATNVLWHRVQRKMLAPDDAREFLVVLRGMLPPFPTGDMALHDVALSIGIEARHSTYDTRYVAFAVAMGASGVISADPSFIRDMRTHSDPVLAGLPVALHDWAGASGILH